MEGSSTCAYGHLLECFVADYGFSQIAGGQTYDVGGNGPSQLVLMFLDQMESLRAVSVLYSLTDHSPTIARLDHQHPRQRPFVSYFWDYGHTNWKSLRQSLAKVDWSFVLSWDETETAIAS